MDGLSQRLCYDSCNGEFIYLSENDDKVRKNQVIIVRNDSLRINL